MIANITADGANVRGEVLFMHTKDGVSVTVVETSEGLATVVYRKGKGVAILKS